MSVKKQKKQKVVELTMKDVWRKRIPEFWFGTQDLIDSPGLAFRVDYNDKYIRSYKDFLTYCRDFGRKAMSKPLVSKSVLYRHTCLLRDVL